MYGVGCGATANSKLFDTPEMVHFYCGIVIYHISCIVYFFSVWKMWCVVRITDFEVLYLQLSIRNVTWREIYNRLNWYYNWLEDSRYSLPFTLFSIWMLFHYLHSVSNVWIESISYLPKENWVMRVIRTNFTGTVCLELLNLISKQTVPVKLVRITIGAQFLLWKTWLDSHI